MSFEEEFDKIIRQKTDEAGFPFDEKNWEKVSQQLDEQRGGAGFMQGKRIYMAAILLLLLSFVGVVIYNTGTQTDKTTLAQTAPLVNAAPDNNASVSQGLKIEKIRSNRNTKAEVKETVPAPQNSEAGINETAVNPASAPVISKQAELEEKNSFNSSARISKRTAASKKAEKEASQASPASPVTKDENTKSASPTVESPVEVQAPENAPIVSVPDNKNVSDISEEAKEVAGLNQAEPLNMIYTSLPLNSEEKDILPVVIQTPKFYDEDYYKKEKFKTHFLNLEAGATYLMGWQTKNGTDAKGLNWYGSINYGLYLSRKITLSGGLQAYNISNIKQPFYSTSQTEYGFTAVRNYTVITAHSLYYVSVPLKVAYAFNSQNQLGVGFNMGYLVNASNTVETYNTSENGKSIPVHSKKTGAYEGIAPTNLLVSAFYKTNITSRLALNGEFVYGLTDLFDNTSANKNTESALGFRLSLQYTLFDK